MRLVYAFLFYFALASGVSCEDDLIEADNISEEANNTWCDGIRYFGGDINEESVLAYNFGSKSSDEAIRKPCDWKITAPPNQVVVLRIMQLKTAAPEECFSQYLDIFDTPGNRLARLCGTIEDGTPIYSTGNVMKVHLYPIWRSYEVLRADISFSYGPESGCGGTLRVDSTETIQSPDVEDLQCFWKIKAPGNHQIVMQFEEVNLPSTCTVGNQILSSCDCGSIEIRDGGGPFSKLIGRVCSNQTATEIRTVAEVGFVAFQLKGRKEKAFKMSLKAVPSPCGDHIIKVNSSNRVFKTPGYPVGYPEVKCFYHFVSDEPGSKVVLRFKDFDLTPEDEFEPGHPTRCLKDYVDIVEDLNDNMVWLGLSDTSTYQGELTTAHLGWYNGMSKHTFCGNTEKPFDYVSNTEAATLFVKPQTEATTRGRGLMIEYTLTGCNRNYTELSGRKITNGDDKSNCSFSIVVPENRTISLYFNYFGVHRSPDCKKASFVVRDGAPDGPILLKACQYRPPDPVFSFTNKLYVQMINTVNAWLPYYSYDFDYVSTEKGRGCGGDIYSYRGAVYSPLYPESYQEATECVWTIRTPVGLHTALKFRHFGVQGNCSDNYLTVLTYTLDQDGRPKEIATKFCPGDKPDVVRSESMIKLLYKSSGSNGGRGWYAIYQGVSPVITQLY